MNKVKFDTMGQKVVKVVANTAIEIVLPTLQRVKELNEAREAAPTMPSPELPSHVIMVKECSSGRYVVRLQSMS